MSKDQSSWILTFLHVYYYKWTTDPASLREFYRESSAVTRKMDSKQGAEFGEEATGLDQCMRRIENCGKINGEVAIHLVDYQNIMDQEGLLISVVGVIRPKNVMDGTPPRRFTHTFVLLRFPDIQRGGEKVWHIHNDIFRIHNFFFPGIPEGAYSNEIPFSFETPKDVNSSPPPPTNFGPPQTSHRNGAIENQQLSQGPSHPPPALAQARERNLRRDRTAPTHPPNLPLPSPHPAEFHMPRPTVTGPAPGLAEPNRVALPQMDKPSPAPLASSPAGLDASMAMQPAGLEGGQTEFNGNASVLPNRTRPIPEQQSQQPRERLRTVENNTNNNKEGLTTKPTPHEVPDQPPQQPQTARQEPPAPQETEHVPDKEKSWATLCRTTAARTGPQMLRPQAGANAFKGGGGGGGESSQIQRGGRRKKKTYTNHQEGRGGGRVGATQGSSPGKRRGKLQEAPAIFFQAKDSDTKPFPDMGITDQHLAEIFGKYGSLSKVDVRPKYGFIYFETEEARDQAVSQKEVDINGVAIRIEKKKPQPRGYGGQNRGAARGQRGGRGRGNLRNWNRRGRAK